MRWSTTAAVERAPFITFVLGILAANSRRLWRWIRRQGPVQIHVESDPEIIYANARNWVTFPQFVPLAEADLPAPPQKTLALGRWAKDLGGLPAWSAELQVTITAWQDLTVVDALRVEARPRAIPEGVVVVVAVGGASLVPRQLDVRLSTLACSVIPRSAGSYEESAGIAMELKGGETQRFSLCVTELEYGDEEIEAYEWTALLDLLVANKRKTIKIDDNGKPFVLVKQNRRPTVTFYGG
jgi:hypothetical protein